MLLGHSVLLCFESDIKMIRHRTACNNNAMPNLYSPQIFIFLTLVGPYLPTVMSLFTFTAIAIDITTTATERIIVIIMFYLSNFVSQHSC